ncbi:MAG: membrane protein insertase YidC [Gammaproteobacteria bacterium]|nr:MAG: membrane protein insertase YidC [Gammaproteobacteria bacterium]
MGNPRILLLVALGFIMMLMWQAWQEDYGPKPASTVLTGDTATQQFEQSQGADAVEVAEISPSDNDDLPTLSSESELARSTALQQHQAEKTRSTSNNYINVITDVLEVKVNPRGGEISGVALKDYPVSLEQPDTPFEFLHTTADKLYVAQSGILSAHEAPNHFAHYQAESFEYRLAEGVDSIRVPLVWRDDSGMEIVKTLIFSRGSHVIDIEYQIKNKSADPWQGRQYRQLVRRPQEQEQGIGMIYTFNGAAYYSDEDKFEKIDFDDIDDRAMSKDVKGGWVGMIEHYFVSSWIPDQNEMNNFYTRKMKKGRYAIGMISPEISVAAGKTGEFTSRLYAGPKSQHVLEQLAPGLKLSVDYGWLTIIAQPIFWLMEFIYKYIVSNWGWAIILLTLSIKLMFFKLSEYGYRSMANMRRVQPKMVALKERYGSDKQRMQQGMMELYRKEKINPMSGCFPILIQIPVFIALYWVLLESVELRQAPFMLWIKDLSVQDPYFVLPLIMGITMFIQQKLNPAPMDETQQMIMKVLPVVFTFFFLFFPAGLVLYWVVNNVLSIAQQWVITRRIEAGAAK